MNLLEQLLSPAVVRALGWTLVHSLWQGAVVALALASLLLLLRQHTARIRYRVAGVALVTLLGLSAVTFGRYYLAAETETVVSPAAMAVPSYTTSNISLGGNLPVITAFAKQTAPIVASSSTAAEPAALVNTSSAWLPYFDQHLPLLVTAWLLGLLAMTLRFLGGLAYLDRLRHYRVRQLPAEWQRRLTALSNRAGLTRPITLLESALVKAPLVAGHLRPVILLPLGTISGLSQAHLEAILAHELAHIIRRDYLMNLIQSITEILFFYHPGVWFVNACLRTERENCCDDMATALCGSPLTVAQALTNLAELGYDRTAVPRLAVAAVGPDGSLLGRVRRLVSRRAAPSFSEGFMAALVVLGGVVLLGVSTAFSMANPYSKATRNQTLVTGNAWRADLLPGLTVLPPTSPLPLGPVREAVVSANTDDKDKDKEKKRRRKGKDDNRVVIVQDGARGRRDAGTVVLERDKKGRVTELYVDGNRIDAKELDAARKQSKDNGTQVIRLNSSQSARLAGRADTRFDFDFNGENSTLSRREQDELRRSLQAMRMDTDKMKRVIVQRSTINGAQLAQLSDVNRSRSQALRAAEQNLRDAERRAESGAEREKIREKIETIRQEQEQVRERQQAEREKAQAEREKLQIEREKLQVEREKQQAERDKARAERDKVRAERDAQVRKAEDAIIDELAKDGLIKDKTHFKFVLTANDLHVNEQKQPQAVFAKYLKMYEQGVGRTIGATGTVTLSYNGGNVNRIYMSRSSSESGSSFMPTPPAAPAAPAAPSAPAPPAAPSVSAAPAAPAAPAPPRAPAAPRVAMVNSVDLGSHLREDGLIGKNDKSYQFQLNATSMTVNGKRQSDELARKYRQLLGEGNNSKFNMNISIKE